MTSSISAVLPWARPSTCCYLPCCVLLQIRKPRLQRLTSSGAGSCRSSEEEGGPACLLPHRWPLLAPWDPPRGCAHKPQVFLLFHFASLLCSFPLASCVLSSHPRAVPCPHPLKARPLPQDMGREALLSSPPSPPVLHLYTPAVSLPRHNHHTGAGKEERPGEARQGWPDWRHSQLSGS